LPKQKFLFFPGNTEGRRRTGWHTEELLELGHAVKPLVLDAFHKAGSTDLELKHVDWVPQPYVPGTIVDVPISFELETLGLDNRVAYLTEEALMALKLQFLAIPVLQRVQSDPDSPILRPISPEDPLLWMKFQDARGSHV
jgi:hypothetical protein